MVILDTSTVYKWYAQDESYSTKALQILENHYQGTESIYAPDLILYELANALVNKTGIGERQVLKHLADFEAAKITLELINFELINKAISLASKFKVTVYDAIFVVLAQEKGCDLITGDDNFANKVKLSFVKKLSDEGNFKV